MTENRQPKFFYGYIVVIAVFFIMMAMWGTFSIFGVFLESFLTEFGWTRAMTSGAASLAALSFGLLCIVTARLNDKFGPRIVIGTCGLFLGLGYILTSQISAIWQLYLFYGLIIAIGMSAYISALSIVAKWFVRRRGMMTGIVFSGMGLGTMIMPLIANWLISNYSWRTSYSIIGIAVLVFTVLAAQFLRRDPGEMGLSPYGGNEVKGDSVNLDAAGLSLREAIHTRQFWLLCALYFSFLLCDVAILVHIVIHATGLGVSAANAAGILAIIGGISIIGMNLMGGAADRIGSRLAFIVSFTLMAMALFWLLAAKEVWMFYLFAGIFGFAFGGMQVLFSPMVSELFGMSSHGVILATAAFAGSVGATIGPVLAGYIFDVTGSYQIAFIICGAVCVAAVIIAVLIRPVYRQAGTNNLRS